MKRILFATYADPKSFLDNLDLAEDGAATLAVDTKAEFEDGEELILEIGYPGLPNRILIRAAALAEGGADGGGYKRFSIADDEELQLDFLIAVASGKAQATLQRRHRRFPLRMAAKVSVDGEEGHDVAETEDMATGGIALKTSEPLPDGAQVTVVLEPGDGAEPIEISGQVVWNRQDDDSVEVGIQFDQLGGEGMRRLRQIIREVKLSGEIR